MKIKIILLFILLMLTFTVLAPLAASPHSNNNQKVIVELLFSRDITSADIRNIERIGGRVIYVFKEIRGLAVLIDKEKADSLYKLEGIALVGQASIRKALSEYLPSSCDSHQAVLSWNLDIVNVPMVHENYGLDGSGVYIAVLDTGLEPQWRSYFPEEKIDTKHAAAFMGALATAYPITYNKNAWEADTNGHGTHVVSTIIGFSVYGLYNVDGVAPGSRIIPVKVLSNAGWGFSTDIAAGILYIANLFIAEKTSGGNVLPPEGIVNPIIISMSLGGPSLSLLEKIAIDYAINAGVFIVASAGNEGEAGMSYPGAYHPVISVGAAGWIGEWSAPAWWRNSDVPEELEGQVYVTDFSSRGLPGQDLDVLAPGSWVVGPYTPYGAAHPPLWANGVPGQYYYLGGTSMAAPHVSGILALVLQKDIEADGEIDLDQSLAEELLESSTIPITWFSATVLTPNGDIVTITWGPNAIGKGLIQADKAVENFAR